MKLLDAYNKFIIDKTVENLSRTTISNYKNMISYYVKFIGEDIETSVIEDIDYVKQYIIYLQSKKVTGKTIHTYIKHLKVFYRWLVNNELIKYNAVADMQIKYEKKLPRVLSLDEIKNLMSVVNLRDRLMLMIALDSGLRKMELTGLNVSDIEKDRIYVRSGKGRKDRIVPLSAMTYQLVQQYIESRPVKTEYLFQCYNNSDRLSYAGVRCVFRRLKLKTGIDRLTPHLLRHTYGTYYINSGGDIKVLQMLLGHSEVQTTETYIHLSNLLNVNNYAQYSIINILSNQEGV